MNRRAFMGAISAGPVMGIPKRMLGEGVSAGPMKRRITGLAGKTLDQLLAEYRHDLFDEFLPLMDRYVIDHQEGGFLCELYEDGSHPDETKNTWFQGRGIWVYSFLYRHFGKNPGHLETARRAVELVLKSRPSRKSEFWPPTLRRNGLPAAPPAATIGADMAIAEGLAEFSRASGEGKYWRMAKDIITKCDTAYGKPGYAPDVVAIYHGPKPFKFPGARTQGVAMLFIGTVGPMLKGQHDAELTAILRKSLDAVMDKHFNPEFQLNNEILNHDYSRPDNELAQFVYTGHCIETLGLILRQAEEGKDGRLFQTAADRFLRHARVAWDDVYGGAFRSLNNVDQDQWELNKNLWVQEEMLCGSLFALAHSGAEWAKRLYEKTYDYIRSKYYLKRWGYTFWISGGDRKVTVHPNLTRVEHYHHPRNLMFGILDLEGLIVRGGAEDTLFT